MTHFGRKVAVWAPHLRETLYSGSSFGVDLATTQILMSSSMSLPTDIWYFLRHSRVTPDVVEPSVSIR